MQGNEYFLCRENKANPMKYLAILILTLTMPVFSGKAVAAELLMLEQNGCAWCKRWHDEIGPVYPNTDEAKLAPLRAVNIHEPWPEDLKHIAMERFTPTFVLIDNGVEIARMRGYTGDEFFWFLLGEMLEKLPKSVKSAG